MRMCWGEDRCRYDFNQCTDLPDGRDQASFRNAWDDDCRLCQPDLRRGQKRVQDLEGTVSFLRDKYTRDRNTLYSRYTDCFDEKEKLHLQQEDLQLKFNESQKKNNKLKHRTKVLETENKIFRNKLEREFGDTLKRERKTFHNELAECKQKQEFFQNAKQKFLKEKTYLENDLLSEREQLSGLHEKIRELRIKDINQGNEIKHLRNENDKLKQEWAGQ